MRSLAATMLLGLFCSLVALRAGFAHPQEAARTGLEKIEHIVIFYLENRSFDNLYGLFPGADGLNSEGAIIPQVDEQDTPYKVLPPVMNTMLKPPRVDPRFPPDLPNRPFRVEQYVPLDQPTGDLIHRFYQEQMQINGGRMNKFVLVSDAKALSMGYYDGSPLPLWRYAKDYVLADHFFHAAFGGSFLNHFWLICACSPRYESAPSSIVAVLDASGKMVKDGSITPDGYAVNTIQSVFSPHDPRITDKSKLLPPQHGPTIGDRLSDKGITWAWYSGGWDNAIAGHPDKLFQFHHQALAYFAQFGDGTAARAEHLKDEKDFVNAIDAGSLPQVVFYKPIGEDNEHPGYTDILTGDRHAANLIARIQASPVWQNTVIIVTYDENGGTWDHVAPPPADRWGPGTRIPTIIISPLAKHGFIDHRVYDTTSILKLIESRFKLEPLGTRDAQAGDLTNALALQ
ncbi:MAG: acid phosphatase [Acetobacteraceae bacterium]|nr:acid phosphatase [Acetobacteraceae bacterium]MBV8523948.1 acid phosphatase [Acetobacteraceae bacterium]